MMTDYTGSEQYPELAIPAEKVSLLEQIVSERNKIQALLGKAEANKGRVKDEIYQKVLSDYEAKLAEVAAKFEPIREEIGSILQEIRKRELALRKDQGSVHDELEELRFRCELGEFSPDELETQEQERGSQVQEYEAKLQTIESAYSICRQYLGEDDFNEVMEGVQTPAEPAPTEEPVEELISIDDSSGDIPPPPPDVEFVAHPEGPVDLDLHSEDMNVEEGAVPPPPMIPVDPIPDEEGDGGSEDPMMTGDPELTLSEPIPMPVEGAPEGGTTLDTGTPGEPEDIEATLSFQKRAFLNLLKEGGDQDTYLLGMESLTIGRNHRNDIVLLDRSISRKHAEVKKEDEGYILVDLSSGGGVLVNGDKKKRSVLKNGDEVTIGDFKLVYKEEMGC
ncbi:MAG: FHA domain-containing protein [Planctomycetota bacterium]|jgi:hypothetical protein